MPWDPEQYHRFQRERFLPFEDLLALVRPRPGMRAVDLGCGTVLIPYLERLTPDLQTAFLACYREKLHTLWPAGPVFYGFRRILFAAARGG
jgi:trans-aconitate methyltransferase